MTVARSKLVDVSLSRWYHCVSRCVRRASLLGESSQGGFDRKAWIEDRLRELADIFAIAVGGFAVLDNHLHLLLRIDDLVAQGWSDEEVVRRWLRLYPPRGSKRKPLAVTDEIVQAKLADAQWVSMVRQRLATLGWFMKCLKEPLARRVNQEENCTGAFFEGRYKSIAILDTESLLSTGTYIDLNEQAAGLAATPEESVHTSIKERIDHAKLQGRTADLRAALRGSIAGSRAASGLEDGLWLVPIEDRRLLDSTREGMLEGFTLGNYLMLVEYTGRLVRDGKASISAELADIFERLGTSVDAWRERLTKLQTGRLVGRFLAAGREQLKAAASHLGVHHLANLNGCTAV
jgi:hypothetical protein